MKKFILPLCLSVIFIVGFKQINPTLDVVGVLLAILMGSGIGVAINSQVFKKTKE